MAAAQTGGVRGFADLCNFKRSRGTRAVETSRVDNDPPTTYSACPERIIMSPCIMLAHIVLLLCAINAAVGHVTMLSPPSWSDAGGRTGLGNCSAAEGRQWRLGNERRVPRLCWLRAQVRPRRQARRPNAVLKCYFRSVLALSG